MAWNEPKSNYIASDEVTPHIFNELAENEKYLKAVLDTKITIDEVLNATITNTIYSTRTNLTANEKLYNGFAKIRRWFSDLKALAFKDTVGDADITSVSASKVTGLHSVATSGNYTQLNNRPLLGALAAKDNVGDSFITDVNASKVKGKVGSAANADNAGVAATLGNSYKSTALTPNEYLKEFSGKEVVETISNATLGLGSTGYALLTTIMPTSTTYGYGTQLAQTTSGLYRRYGLNASSWSNWERLLTANELGSLSGVATLDANGRVVQKANSAVNADSATNATNYVSGGTIATKFSTLEGNIGKIKIGSTYYSARQASSGDSGLTGYITFIV